MINFRAVATPWLLASVAVPVCLACDFSGTGLTVGPAVERGDAAAGAGGRAPVAGASGAGGGQAGSGPSDSAPPPEPQSDAGSGPAAEAGSGPVDASAEVGGSSGVNSIDARPPIDAAPPADAPPAVDPRGQCPGDGSLLLCLSFEGPLADESSPPAQLESAELAYEAGPTGRAVRLHPGAALSAANVGLDPQSDFTLEVWVRPDSLPTGSNRAAVLDKDGHFGLFLLPGGGVTCINSGAVATAPGLARAGQWLSVGCTGAGATLSVWVDGQRRAQAARPAPPGVSPQAAIGIGRNMPSGDPLTGLMDNVRIWGQARSAQQICQAAHGCD